MFIFQHFQGNLCQSHQIYCLTYTSAIFYLEKLKKREDFRTYLKVKLLILSLIYFTVFKLISLCPEQITTFCQMAQLAHFDWSQKLNRVISDWYLNERWPENSREASKPGKKSKYVQKAAVGSHLKIAAKGKKIHVFMKTKISKVRLNTKRL